MAKGVARLTIGQVARRTGLAVSAIRFYEERGLVAPLRNAGGQRRFRSSEIRRLSFVLIADTAAVCSGLLTVTLTCSRFAPPIGFSLHYYKFWRYSVLYNLKLT